MGSVVLSVQLLLCFQSFLPLSSPHSCPLALPTFHFLPLRQVVFLYAASDSSNAFRMFLLLLEFSLGPDPCDDPASSVLPSNSSIVESPPDGSPAGEIVGTIPSNHIQGEGPVSPQASLLMGLPRGQGGVYFTAGLLTCLAQKSANLAALYLSFVIIGAGDSVSGLRCCLREQLSYAHHACLSVKCGC